MTTIPSYILHKSVNGKSYLLENDEGVFFAINEPIYDILYHMKNGQSVSAITSTLNRKYNTTVYNDDLIKQTLDDEKVKAIFYPDKNLPTAVVKRNKYIFLKISLIKPEKIKLGLQKLSFLFQNNVMAIISFISILLTVAYFVFHWQEISIWQQTINSVQSNWVNLIPLYICFMLIILLHEVGHAVASLKFQIVPKDIGFGFYIVFPVFYTELTRIWVLPNKQRVIVNIGGIYFQLIINFLLTCVVFFYNELFIKELLLMNTTSCIFSLHPFFRNDGYWVFSDYFNIINLEKKAQQFIRLIFQLFYAPAKAIIKINIQPKILGIYAVLNFFFWIYFYCTISFGILDNYHSQWIIINSASISILQVLKILLLLFITTMFIRSIYMKCKSFLEIDIG